MYYKKESPIRIHSDTVLYSTYFLSAYPTVGEGAQDAVQTVQQHEQVGQVFSVEEVVGGEVEETEEQPGHGLVQGQEQAQLAETLAHVGTEQVGQILQGKERVGFGRKMTNLNKF